KHFYVPPEVEQHTRLAIERAKKWEEEWNARFAKYKSAHSDLARQWDAIQKKELPEGWDAKIPTFPPDPKGLATRESSGKVENTIAPLVPWFMGGSADLAPSTKTLIAGETDFEAGHYAGRNFHFGIREHAMGSILNGMAVSKLRVFGAGFLIFSDYMRASIRLAALMDLPVIYVF